MAVRQFVSRSCRLAVQRTAAPSSGRQFRARPPSPPPVFSTARFCGCMAWFFSVPCPPPGRAVRLVFPSRTGRRPLRRATGPVRRASRPLGRASRPIRRVTGPLRRTLRPLGRATGPLRRATGPLRRASRRVRQAPRPNRRATRFKGFSGRFREVAVKTPQNKEEVEWQTSHVQTTA